MTKLPVTGNAALHGSVRSSRARCRAAPMSSRCARVKLS